MKKKIVIAGGTGFLGQSIQEYYQNDDVDLVVLTRRKSYHSGQVRFVQWDGKTPGAWTKELEGATAVINLCGRSVNCRYTEKNKKEIIESRVIPTLLLGNAIARTAVAPKVWINGGSTAIFGDGGPEIKDEDAVAGSGFSPQVCKEWEKAFYSVDTPGTRKVLLRIGIVLQKGRGLLKPFKRLVRLGLGGKFGNGEQYISWIHEEDFLNIIDTVIKREDLIDTIHCTSPRPVKNKDFLKSLRANLNMPVGIPNPAIFLKMGATIIGTEAELLLTGRRVVSKILNEKDFAYKYASIDDAFYQLVRQ